jgi:hypothetical protein
MAAHYILLELERAGYAKVLAMVADSSNTYSAAAKAAGFAGLQKSRAHGRDELKPKPMLRRVLLVRHGPLPSLRVTRFERFASVSTSRAACSSPHPGVRADANMRISKV